MFSSSSSSSSSSPGYICHSSGRQYHTLTRNWRRPCLHRKSLKLYGNPPPPLSENRNEQSESERENCFHRNSKPLKLYGNPHHHHHCHYNYCQNLGSCSHTDVSMDASWYKLIKMDLHGCKWFTDWLSRSFHLRTRFCWEFYGPLVHARFKLKNIQGVSEKVCFFKICT